MDEGVYTGASFCFAIPYEMRGKLYATAGFWGVWGKQWLSGFGSGFG